jgi:hypothetical protein
MLITNQCLMFTQRQMLMPSAVPGMGVVHPGRVLNAESGGGSDAYIAI